MKEWGFAQLNPSDRLARLHWFSVCKPHEKGEVEMMVTVREYVTPKDPEMLFFAQAHKDTNQRTAPYRPGDWGRTLFEALSESIALSECMKAVHRFPYQGTETE